MGLSARKVESEYRDWSWNAWRPHTTEDDYEITQIEGEIPRDLRGSYHRIGPSQSEPYPQQGYDALHAFDGDGMAHAFRIEDGRAHYRNRFVRHPSFESEKAAGRPNQDWIGVSVEDRDPSILIRQQPNTNIVWHGGKLMAMVENDLPFEIDPKTLGPIGTTDFGGGAIAPWMSAHPTIDPKTGQMLNHGYFVAPPFCTFYVIEPDGSVSLAREIDTGSPSFMHDNAITENYFIVIAQPIALDVEWKDGLPVGRYGQWMTWRPEQGLRFGVVKREQDAPVRWFDAPNPYALFHTGNAFERGNKIVMDAFMYRNGGAFVDSLAVMRSGDFREGTGAIPVLYEIDLESGDVKETILSDKTGEWPRCDPRRVGYENRFGYAIEAERDIVFLADGPTRLLKYDRSGGEAHRHDFGRGHFPMEPVFAPKHAESAEDEGYVMTVVYDAPEDSSYLAILDAQNIGGECLAKLQLRDRVPNGFHGNWSPGLL